MIYTYGFEIEGKGIAGIDSLDDIANHLLSLEYIGLDTETTRKHKKYTYSEQWYKAGLDPYLTDILMIQMGNEEHQYIFDMRSEKCKGPEFKEFLEKILTEKKLKKILHNAKFDLKHILHNYEIWTENIWDTMICEQILYNGLNYRNSLMDLAKRYLDAKDANKMNLFNGDDYITEEKDKILSDDDMFLLGTVEEGNDQIILDKSVRKEFVEWGDKPFTLEQIYYGSDDCILPCKIYKLQRVGRRIKDEQWRPDLAFRMENKVTQCLADIELVGMPFDEALWRDTYAQNVIVLAERKKVLDDFVINNCPDFTGSIDMFRKEPVCAVQWSSFKQVVTLFKRLGIARKERSKQTKRKEWTVGAKVMFRQLSNDLKIQFYKNEMPEDLDLLANDYKGLILAYLLYKKSEQLTTTFGLDWLKHIHPVTGRIHTNFRQYMSTGRVSSSRPNCQQLPSTPLFRRCFTDGTPYVNCDYASQESRVLADLSKNETLIDFYNNGHPTFGSDLHSYTATMMYRALLGDSDLVITKKTDAAKRNTAKGVGFSIVYGASEYSIAQNLGITEEEGVAFINSYFDAYPGLREHFEKGKSHFRKNGWIRLCPFSDKRYFFKQYDEMWRLFREAVELRPQSWEHMNAQQKEECKAVLRETTNWNDLWREHAFLRGAGERKSMNYFIQGSAASQLKMALILFYRDRTSKSQHISLVCHDEALGMSEDTDLLEQTRLLVQKSMEDGGAYVVKSIPMVAESQLSLIWEH